MLVKLLGTRMLSGVARAFKEKPWKSTVVALLLVGYLSGGWTLAACWLLAGMVWFRERVKLLALAGARRAGRWLKQKGREKWDAMRQSAASN